MAYLTQFLVVFITAVLINLAQARKIKLEDVRTLTLRHGEMTSSRRSSPVPQLKCLGGKAGCNAFIPQHVQCYNRGSDGYDIQWECKTDMENKYRFGKIDISCEGYDYADDPYILAGSCGLEYTIDYSSNSQSSAYNSYSKPDYNDHQTSFFGSTFGFICVIMIIFFVYRTCFAGASSTSYENMSSGSSPPPYTERADNNYNNHPHGPPPPYGFRPEYQQQPKQYPTSGQQQYSPNSNNDGQPGFFSGMLAGGLMGYLFGNNRSDYGNSYYNRGYQRDLFGSPFNSGGNGGAFSSFGNTGASSLGSRTTSGFGGTKRR